MEKVAKTTRRAAAPDKGGTRGSRKDAINAAIALFHRRWILRVLWELRAGAMNFRALQQACGDLSPTVLNERLRDLRDAALIDHVAGEGYGLTPRGHELLVAMEPMAEWAVRWHAAVPRRTARTGPR